MFHNLEPDPIFKLMFSIVATLATLGMVTLLLLIGLGMWKFVELIS
jgi:hypothetical protein